MSDDQSEGTDCYTKWLFRASLLFTLAASFYFGYRDATAIMGLAITAGGLGMAFCSLDRIALFKIGSAELRTLKQDVREASETLERIKSLALELSKPILGIIAAGDRYGGSATKMDATARQITDYLRRLGTSETDIDGSLEHYHAYRIWDHGQHIEMSCNNNNRDAIIQLQLLKSYDELFVSPPNAYRQKLDELNLLDEHTENAVRDYEHYLMHKELRRPDKWLNTREQLEAMTPD